MRFSEHKDDTPFVMSIPKMLRDLGQENNEINAKKLWDTMMEMCFKRELIGSAECDFAKGICIITPVTRPLFSIDEHKRKRAARSSVRGVAQE